MTPWDRATTALRLLWVDPGGLGGIVLRARAGPARDAFLRLTDGATRLHPAMTLETLDGGLDVSASLAESLLIRQKGLLEGVPRTLVVAMAERLPPLFATRLCGTLDAGDGHRIIALDEGAEDDEKPPLALMDRLAFHVSLEGLGLHDISPDSKPLTAIDPAKLCAVGLPDDALEELVTLAVTLGISSLRAPAFALRAARANAALLGRNRVISDDILIAAELVYAPRATRFPEEPPEEPERPEDQNNTSPSKSDALQIPQDILLNAIKTALPPDLLTKSGSNPAKSGTGSGAGRKKIGNRKGRPLPARDVTPRGSQPRVDLMATLRAAVPWQTLRKHQQPHRTGPIIHPSDLRYRRYEDLSDRLLVFAVDASGSAAMARLAEAKGAVEILLAEAYARRDHVALVSFRGDAAEVLLPPTRSLVQTKRRLAELPGGGGTPLASGMKLALETAQAAFRKGLSPVVVLLTDGRSNIALDGSPDRIQAASDAQSMARQIAMARIDSIVIDTGRRPEPALRDLAAILRGRYASLPRADAQRLSETVNAALAD